MSSLPGVTYYIALSNTTACQFTNYNYKLRRWHLHKN